MQDFVEFGFPYPKGLLMTFIGGSQLHGAKLSGKDDTDWYGVFVEPPEPALGLDAYPHFVFTTGGQKGGNQPHDVDVCLYSLRKFAGLAAKGNPSVLHFLFAKAEFESPHWMLIATEPEPFLAKTHLKPFLGYASDQLKCLLGKRARDTQRADLVEKYGYDTKYAMHLIRLLGEGKELIETGRITLPRSNAKELIAIRHGKYKLREIAEMASQLEVEAIEAQRKSPLPEKVNRAEISRRVAMVYRKHWNQHIGSE
jgi:predicted nucleotidyltransferase